MKCQIIIIKIIYNLLPIKLIIMINQTQAMIVYHLLLDLMRILNKLHLLKLKSIIKIKIPFIKVLILKENIVIIQKMTVWLII